MKVTNIWQINYSLRKKITSLTSKKTIKDKLSITFTTVQCHKHWESNWILSIQTLLIFLGFVTLTALSLLRNCLKEWLCSRVNLMLNMGVVFVLVNSPDYYFYMSQEQGIQINTFPRSYDKDSGHYQINYFFAGLIRRSFWRKLYQLTCNWTFLRNIAWFQKYIF